SEASVAQDDTVTCIRLLLSLWLFLLWLNNVDGFLGCQFY
ncbi:MAG: hypothetical protein ACI9EW_004210, partial [Cellvibrionaceae bacterium]